MVLLDPATFVKVGWHVVYGLNPLIICNAISCPLYNLIAVIGISTELNTFIKHIQTTCHAQEP